MTNEQNHIHTHFINRDLQDPNIGYVNVPLARNGLGEVVGAGDEGISDCSPGTSERDSCSPAPRGPTRRESLKTMESSPIKLVGQSDGFHDQYSSKEPSPCRINGENDGSEEFEDTLHEKELSELRLGIAKHKVDLERAIDHIHYLEEVNLQQGLARAELEAKYQTLVQRYETAKKEKEATVMRYAVSEKNVIEQKNAKETVEKQLRDALKEVELLNNKVAMSNSEKNRICQMFDNKCHELTTQLREGEKLKITLGQTESTVKSLKSQLKNESDSRRELQSTIESLNSRLQIAVAQIDQSKKEAQDAIRVFKESQENKAYLLDKQLKEVSANLILARHECSDREQRSHHLQNELDNLQQKYEKVIRENNTLSMKIQNLEQERLDTDKKLQELRESKNKETEISAKTKALELQLEQMKIKSNSREDKLMLLESQVDQLKNQNTELQTDLDACVRREEEMLKFTQSLTEKNVRLQSEYSAVETKVQQLQCESESLRRSNKEMQLRLGNMTSQLDDEKVGRTGENTILTRHLAEKTQEVERLKRDLEFQKGENQVLKRKFDISLKQMTKELQQCHKQIEVIESSGEGSKATGSKSSSHSSPINGPNSLSTSPAPQNDSDNSVQNGTPNVIHSVPVELDKHALLDHVMRLQRISARKSEKLDFLESHVQTLVTELQKKSRLLQDYMVRDQTGALTSNAMDHHKAEVAKSKGVMASMFNSKVSDNNLTLELTLDINRKLQAVLEDTLLKNITLKESVDTLGMEIERLKLKETAS